MTTATDSSSSAPVIRAAKLGEELPIFCERCGYNLNGLQQTRCEHCDILQFHCPECGHHQPINTLRPAAQRIIGRLRAVWLCGVVLFKLNFFGWLLVAWIGMGGAWSYSSTYTYNTPGGPASSGVPSINFRPTEVDYQEVIAFSSLALLFGMGGRMLLLRWRRSERIGAILATLATLAIIIGVRLAFRDYSMMTRPNGPGPARPLESPWTGEFIAVVAWTAVVILAGAILVWPNLDIIRSCIPSQAGFAPPAGMAAVAVGSLAPNRQACFCLEPNLRRFIRDV